MPLFRIKRTKKPPAPATTPPAVHYALSVTDAGNVTGWTPKVDLAASFTKEVTTLVKAFYADRENAGDLKFEPLPEPKVESPVTTSASVPPLPIPADVVTEPKPSLPLKVTK